MIGISSIWLLFTFWDVIMKIITLKRYFIKNIFCIFKNSRKSLKNSCYYEKIFTLKGKPALKIMVTTLKPLSYNTKCK